MNKRIRALARSLTERFDAIPPDRKALSARLAAYIQTKYDQDAPINLVFICTHNSRRSHFGQVAAALAAAYYAVDRVRVFSGGTEATAFHPNAIKALRDLGFRVETPDAAAPNPVWTLYFGEQAATACFSKTFDDAANPRTDFAAVMTCTDAEQNCPFVPGADLRLGITYQDPKASDGSPEQDATYQARFLQIATEILYTFSLIQ